MAATVGGRLAPPSAASSASASNAGSLLHNSPMSMRLLATMEVDGTSPNCVPRLCTLKITRLSILKTLEAAPETTSSSSSSSSFILAVKMQGIRRVLRSNEIPQEADLDITFELAYPHYLKRDGNKLQIMLQRRKRYRSRPVMGFKTLAIGCVNMAHILQRSVESGRTIPLFADTKSGSSDAVDAPLAEVRLGTLMTQPMDEQDHHQARSTTSSGRRSKAMTETAVDRSPDNDSDDDFLEDDFLEDPMFCAENGSDSEGPQGIGTEDEVERPRKNKRRTKIGQRNLKQRFVALLRKFKVNEEVLASEHDHDDPEMQSIKNQEIEDIFNELEECYHTDSDPDDDDRSIMSVLSTPKPTLRPFFAPVSGLSRSQDIVPVVSPGEKNGDAMDDLESGIQSVSNVQLPEALAENIADEELTSDMLASSTGISGISLLPPIEHSASSAPGGIGGICGNAASLGVAPTMSSMSPIGAAVMSSSAGGATLSSFSSSPHIGNSAGSATSNNNNNQMNNPSPPKSAGNAQQMESGKEEGKTVTRRSRPPSVKMESKRQGSKEGVDIKANVVRKDSQGKGDGSPRKALLDHLSSILGDRDAAATAAAAESSATDSTAANLAASSTVTASSSVATATSSLPEHLFMINGTEYVNANVLADLLQERGLKVVTTFSAADVKATLGHLLAKIQKFCHSNSRPPNPVKILLLGSDAFITSVLKPYILELSSKPPDWQGYLRFLVVSLSSSSSHSIAKHLSLIDASYRSLFDDVTWRENLDKIDSLKKDAQDEIVGRLLQYIGGADVTLQLPVAEAMLTLREKSSEEDSTQVNVPFISDVRIGNLDIDADDASSFLNNSMNSSVSSSIDTPGPHLSGNGGGGGGGGGSPPSSSMISNFIGKESEKEKEKRGDEKKEKEEDRRKSGLNFVYEGLYPEPSSGGGGGIGCSSAAAAVGGGSGVNSVVAGSSGIASTVGTPPNSPLLMHQGSFPAFQDKTSTPGSDKYVITSSTEVQEVQVDYWTPMSKQESSQSLGLTTEKEEKEKESEKKKKEKTEKFKIETDGAGGAVGKNSLKGHVRFLQVSRLSGSSYAGLLSMLVLTKEKKAKMIRIGKKSKENAEGKSQVMEGITRLICSATKNHNLRVGIDGVEWNGVKFFQLSAQWNSQIKQFPVLIFANLHQPQQQQQQFAHGNIANQGNQTRP